jgi:hypothetical protein
VRRIRNLSFAALTVVAAASVTRPAFAECDPPLEEMCSYFEQFLGCSEWDSSCTMVNSYSQQEADEECMAIGMECGWAGAAQFNGDCWECQFESTQDRR